MRSDDRFAEDLPWGWWLRVNGSRIEDEHGNRWSSVRDAFWQGRLGFPSIHFAPEQHELMLRVLSAIHARWLGEAENKHDLFNGDMLFWRFYQCWLASIGMLQPTGLKEPLAAPLSREGRSVMLMLQATREPEWERLPMADVVAAVAGCRDGSDAERERVLDGFERQVGFRRHVFAREDIGRLHQVTLTGVATEGRMPMRRVTWSQSFSDRRGRDDLFAWLAERVDRWDDWGEMAYRKGADAFASHLLGLIVSTAGLTKRSGPDDG